MNKKRKIVHIAGVEQTVAALCDDGSVWLLAISYDEGFSKRNWVKAPNIPQTDASKLERE